MIIRANRDKWVTADTGWIKDTRLSAKAKGILIYILSLPDDWDLHIKELVTHFTDGIDGIRSGMKELNKFGYVDSNQRRGVDGKVIGYDYTIFETPGEPYMENPDMEKDTLLSTKEKLSTNNILCPTQEQKDIIAHLNNILGLKSPKGFKDNNQQTLRLLNARLKDYTKADVIAVIDFMAEKWLNSEWRMFLRPQTLFNVNKFEGYVANINVEGSESAGVIPLQTLK